MNQIPDYIKLLEENEDFLNAIEIEKSDQEYITLRNNLFSEIAQEETVAFTGNVSKYSQEQIAKACLHRYLYLVAEQILSSDDFADNMSFEEKEVRKMRIFDKLEEIYTDIHAPGPAINRGSSRMVKDEITNKIRNTLRREPLTRIERVVLKKITAPALRENKLCRSIIMFNIKMYYLYLDQLLSLQEIESALRADTVDFYSNKTELLETIEDLKQENNKCSWDTFNSMASMKKTIVDKELKNYPLGWSTWVFRGEAPAIERHSRHQKSIANFRDTLKKTRSTMFLLEGDHPLKLLANGEIFTNSQTLHGLKIKKIVGLFVSCALPYLLIAFFMEHREYIEKIEQCLYSTDTLFKTVYMVALGALGALFIGCGYFWKNCHFYGDLKQIYSKEAKKTYLGSIGFLSFVEMAIVIGFVFLTIFNLQANMSDIPTKASQIQAKISYNETIIMKMSFLTYINLCILLIENMLLHFLNRFALFRLRYWKNYFTSTLGRSLLIVAIIIFAYACGLGYYKNSIRHLKTELDYVLPVLVSSEICQK
ncbi:hypothetical protein NECID01_2136, partial [Nematocida sp. AWRm77]